MLCAAIASIKCASRIHTVKVVFYKIKFIYRKIRSRELYAHKKLCCTFRINVKYSFVIYERINDTYEIVFNSAAKI